MSSYYFIVNPASNGGKVKKRWPEYLEHIEKKLGETPDWQFTDHPEHAIEMAQEAIEQGYKRLMAIGGDGTANEMVNGFMRSNGKKHNVSIAMIPAGTSNDGHKIYNLDGTYESLDRVFAAKEPVWQPAIKITGDFGDYPYYAWNHLDCGLSSLAAREANKPSRIFKGEFKYTYHALRQVIKFKNNPGTVTVNGEEHKGEFTVIATSLGEDIGGFKLWPGNNLSHGDLGLLFAHGQTRFKLLKLLLAAENGNHLSHEGVVYTRTKKFTIDLEMPWPYEAEGEIYTQGTKYTEIEYVDNTLPVLM